MPINLGKLSAAFAVAVMPLSLASFDAAAQTYQTSLEGLPGPIYSSKRTTTPIHAVSVHAGPSRAAPVIGTLRPGMPVEILSVAAPGWLQVRSGSEEGWAWGSYFPGGAGEFVAGARALPGGETGYSPAASATDRLNGVSPAEIASP